jgi:hypothetical protein
MGFHAERSQYSGVETKLLRPGARTADDPRRPPGYQPLERFWQHRGYTRHPELRTTFSWQEIGETAESPKPMVFWLSAALPAVGSDQWIGNIRRRAEETS